MITLFTRIRHLASSFLREEDGVGVVEIILILVVIYLPQIQGVLYL